MIEDVKTRLPSSLIFPIPLVKGEVVEIILEHEGISSPLEIINPIAAQYNQQKHKNNKPEKQPWPKTKERLEINGQDSASGSPREIQPTSDKPKQSSCLRLSSLTHFSTWHRIWCSTLSVQLDGCRTYQTTLIQYSQLVSNIQKYFGIFENILVSCQTRVCWMCSTLCLILSQNVEEDKVPTYAHQPICWKMRW